MFAVSFFLICFFFDGTHMLVYAKQNRTKKTFWNLFVQRYIIKILMNILKINSDFSFAMKLLIFFTDENTCMSQNLNSRFM